MVVVTVNKRYYSIGDHQHCLWWSDPLSPLGWTTPALLPALLLVDKMSSNVYDAISPSLMALLLYPVQYWSRVSKIDTQVPFTNPFSKYHDNFWIFLHLQRKAFASLWRFSTYLQSGKSISYLRRLDDQPSISRWMVDVQENVGFCHPKPIYRCKYRHLPLSSTSLMILWGDNFLRSSKNSF